MFNKHFSAFVAALFLASLSSGALADTSFVFLDRPSTVEVVVGSSTLSEVSVKNIGDYERLVELGVETNGPVSVGVVPGSLSVGAGRTATFTLSFLSSPTNLLNKYPSKLRLRGNGVDVSENFDLVILPTPEKKFDINNAYLSLLNKFEGLSKRFDQVKDSGCVLVTPGDFSVVTPKQITDSLQNLNDNLEKTRIAIKENDFVTANLEEEKAGSLISRVESEINSLRSSQEECEKDKARVSGYITGGMVTTTAGLIVIVLLVGFIAYRHYTRLPKVRKLLPSSNMPPVKVNQGENQQPTTQSPGVTRIRTGFQYDFKKKK